MPYGQAYKLLDDEFSSTLREIAFAGYGLFFISHSKEKTIEENGVERIQTVPALADRPFNIVNKMVDIIAFLDNIPIGQNEDGSFIRKRFLFLRETDQFYAGSRFKYIEPKIEMSYENLINAIYTAIDKEVERTGGTATETKNPYYQRTFENLMDEAKAVWTKVIQKEKGKEASEILEKTFGKPTKFSEITESDKDKLEIVLSEIQEIV